MTTGLTAWMLAFGLATSAGVSPPEVHHYAIVIGNNALPVNHAPTDLQPLRFADDDAALFYQFIQHFTQRAFLLAVLDAETQARFPGVAAQTRAPTIQAILEAVDAVSQSLQRDHRAGVETVVFLFFSGHGTRSASGAHLALADGALTRTFLYDQMIARLPARTLHLVVDACYAEAVVRPRALAAKSAPDLSTEPSAEVVEVNTTESAQWVEEITLRRFLHVGATMAATANRQTHEWTTYQGGVFTHQVISGLRGAADVNGDRRIEYSELHAFLTAANREVKDPRARLHVVVVPPAQNLRTPIVDLQAIRGVGWLLARDPPEGHAYIDRMGRGRIVDLNVEADHPIAVAVPASTALTLHTDRGDATFSVDADGIVELEFLPLKPNPVTPRGAVATALRQGLFAHPFGPAYYQGFVDRLGQVGVSARVLPAPTTLHQSVLDPAPTPPPSNRSAWIAFATATGLAAVAATTGWMALDARADFDATDLEKPAADARDRYDTYRYAAWGTGAAALITAALGGWLYSISSAHPAWPNRPR